MPYHITPGCGPRNFSSYSQAEAFKRTQGPVSHPFYPLTDARTYHRGAGGFGSKSVSSCGPWSAFKNGFPGNGHPGGAGAPCNYSSPGSGHVFMNTGGGAPGKPCITSVTCNKSLLQPLDLGIDTSALALKCQAKDELKSLNSKFASLIDKVQLLEQHNLKLKTTLDFIEAKKCHKSDMEPLFDGHVSRLKKELECVEQEKKDLKTQCDTLEQTLEDNKTRYQEELNRRVTSENEFVLLKKDLDFAFSQKAELEAKVEKLGKHLSFLKHMYEKEISELQNCISETCVMVQVDNRRALDMNRTIEEFRRQHEHIASRSRAEAEAWLHHQYQELKTTAAQNNDNLKNVKEEIQALTQTSHQLESQISNLKAECKKLEEEVTSAKECGEEAMKDARSKLSDMEEALRKAKQDMACQLREYQALMDIKMALNIEIATYKKLMEGEECWLNKGERAVNLRVQRSEGAIVCDSNLPQGSGNALPCGTNQSKEDACGSDRATPGGSATPKGGEDRNSSSSSSSSTPDVPH